MSCIKVLVDYIVVEQDQSPSVCTWLIDEHQFSTTDVQENNETPHEHSPDTQ